MYMSVLSSLSVDEKLDLIAKLPNSIRNTYTKEQDIETEDPFACYEGDWGGNMSAEEYADDLRCLLYTSPSPRDRQKSRMPSSA